MSAKAAARSYRGAIIAALVSIVVYPAGPWGWPNSARAADTECGEKLFRHIWESGDLVAGSGDGLGPMYNERSCVACHFLGGAGGAGPNKNNVDILSGAPPTDQKHVEKLIQQLGHIHSGFGRGTSIVLHHYSTDGRYAPFRDRLLGIRTPTADATRQMLAISASRRSKKSDDSPIKTLHARGATLLLSQRNTTPLFGAGLIDAISEKDIREAGAAEGLENRGISGRFVGRFGWRGQVATLKNFVLGACAVEVGLQNPDQAQMRNPLLLGQTVFAPGQPITERLDMTPEYCDDLVAYVVSLPRPRQLPADDAQQTVYLQHGQNLFETVGCVLCHRPQLGSVAGLYSDLLLHDMGTRLEDPASASSFASSEYYGPPPDLTSPFAAERRREWKTPPLWGLQDSKPYLHDGRAATIEEAIDWHGGEAASSRERYVALPAEARAHIVLFLSTLRAPTY
jgi:CxxC motif-containing protein (DUF1111 family)